MREDTLMAEYPGAHRKCGRAQDAQQYYDLYVQKYVTAQKMPSKQLRMIAGAEKGKESIETSGEITKLGFYDAM